MEDLKIGDLIIVKIPKGCVGEGFHIVEIKQLN